MSTDDSATPIEAALADFIARRESGETLSAAAFVEQLTASGFEHASATELLRALRQLEETEDMFPPLEHSTGRKIGPYRILGELGRGGMGRVLRVEHEDSPGVEYALKVLSMSSQLNPRLRKRFERECSQVMQIEHPGVVRIREVATDADEPYLVMDLIEGKTLAQLIVSARNEKGTHPSSDTSANRLGLGGEGTGAERVARTIAKLAHAVSELHARRIIHRDVKPGNVIIDGAAEPVLIDFGLATREDSSTLTRTGDLLGTPHYMAPEQARGEEADERVDVYALGAMLHELLSLHPPHKRSEPILVLESIRTIPAAPIRRLEPGVPPALARIVDRALAFRRESRYESAAALAADLEAFVAGEPVQAHSMWPERARHGLRRRGPLLLGGLALLCALIAGGSYLHRNNVKAQAVTLRQAIDRAAMSWGLDDLEETRRAAMQILSIDPGNQTGEFLLAIGNQSVLVDSEDASIEALIRGIRLRGEGFLKEAREQFRLAGQLAPSSPLPLVMTGMVATALGDIEERARLLEEACEREPESAAYARELGQSYFDLDRFALARKAFERAIANDPEYPRSWFDLARAQVATGEYAAGLATAREAARQFGKPGDDLLAVLSVQLMEEKQYEMARGALLEIIDRREPDADLYLRVARSYDFAEELKHAVAWYHKALDVEPMNSEVLKSLLHLHTGANRDTCDDCALAFEESPELYDPEEAARCGLLLLGTNRGKNLGLTLWIVEKFQQMDRTGKLRPQLLKLARSAPSEKATKNLERALSKLDGR